VVGKGERGTVNGEGAGEGGEEEERRDGQVDDGEGGCRA
jgi:hypothetical protein